MAHSASSRLTVRGVTVALREDVHGAEAAAMQAQAPDAERTAWADRPEWRRAGFLTGRALLRQLVDEAIRPAAGDRMPSPPAVQAVCSDCGGPHGPARLAGFRVAVSHSDGMTAVAVVSDEDAVAAGIATIGLDLESAAISPERVAALESLTRQDFADPALAARRWTQIEAVLKADGRGLRVPPHQVVFESDTPQGSIARIVDRPGVVYEVHPVAAGAARAMSLALARPAG